jgi:hypothetical protein
MPYLRKLYPDAQRLLSPCPPFIKVDEHKVRRRHRERTWDSRGWHGDVDVEEGELGERERAMSRQATAREINEHRQVKAGSKYSVGRRIYGEWAQEASLSGR